ncbi:MAG: aldehyde dehydrogenase (NADP(+)) [Terriglobales bacterium]
MITSSLIGGEAAPASGAGFKAHAPAGGAELEPVFHSAAAADVARAAELAATAFETYRRCGGKERGAFLRAIAAEIEARKAALIERAEAETALPAARLEGETARTCNQLRLFAELVEEGSWVDARLDSAQARAQGPRKPDLRSLLRPLGPVAVFGASNFPLAFSVAGGDTASALAAGCPVLVKAHPAHPGTSALAGEAVVAAARRSGMPAGVFALLFDAGIEIGAALVQHAAVRAVGFTGSLRAGRRLMDLAAARPAPIPVYAEMGSANPVFVLPRALAERGLEIAQGLHTSITQGAGQFCTKPGLLLLPAGDAATPLLLRLGELMAAPTRYTLLTAAIANAYAAGAAARRAQPAVQTLAAAQPALDCGSLLMETSAAALLADPALAEELFGPAAVVVRHRAGAGGEAELLALARSLGGHLTATVHGTPEDLAENLELLRILEQRVGRIVINGFPTGVEVTSAMVHGGPYPATSLPSSSVGTRAITRFTRPLCYQDAPEAALPPELHAANPLGIWRLLDGHPSRENF